jgi:hypothetical protein
VTDATPASEEAPRRRRWTEQIVVAELLALYQRGVPLTRRHLLEAGEHQLVHAIQHFGGMRRVRKLAGVAPPPKSWQPRELDEAALMAEIRRRYREHEPLARARVSPELQNAADSCFGSWQKAITAAGFDYELIRLTRRHTTTELLQFVRELARDRPDLTLREFREHTLASTIHDRFGGIELAARRAGVPGWPLRRRASR